MNFEIFDELINVSCEATQYATKLALVIDIKRHLGLDFKNEQNEYIVECMKYDQFVKEQLQQKEEEIKQMKKEHEEEMKKYEEEMKKYNEEMKEEVIEQVVIEQVIEQVVIEQVIEIKQVKESLPFLIECIDNYITTFKPYYLENITSTTLKKLKNYILTNIIKNVNDDITISAKLNDYRHCDSNYPKTTLGMHYAIGHVTRTYLLNKDIIKEEIAIEQVIKEEIAIEQVIKEEIAIELVIKKEVKEYLTRDMIETYLYKEAKDKFGKIYNKKTMDCYISAVFKIHNKSFKFYRKECLSFL